MTELVLTEQQEIFVLHQGGAFVHACPGAGKTRAIIARLARRAKLVQSRRGVAVLSFTNSACQEFRSRCRQQGLHGYLHHPHFMGTLDAFVQRFIARPALVIAHETSPRFLDTWNRFEISVRLPHAKNGGVPLQAFAGKAQVDWTQVPYELERDVKQNLAKYAAAGAREIERLNRAGYYSAEDARAIALKTLEDAALSNALRSVLRGRFDEVIVDEVQDCNPSDHQILKWLSDAAIGLSVVGDPDQAIYSFRDGSTQHLTNLAEQYAHDSRLQLTGNVRSAFPICRVAASLRQTHIPDDAVGPHGTIEWPVLLVGYGSKVDTRIADAFLEQLQERQLLPSQAILLSHATAVARSAVGLKVPSKPGSSRLANLAEQVQRFWSPQSGGRDRVAAVEAVGRMLIEMQGLGGSSDPIALEQQAEKLDRELRRDALQVLIHIPPSVDDDDATLRTWCQKALEAFNTLSLKFPHGQSLRTYFRQAGKPTWSAYLKRPSSTGLSFATVHEAKGREYAAVCVVIPPDTKARHTEQLIGDWEQRVTRHDDDSKRVLYVAVTRAQQFLALAVPHTHVDRCMTILERADVPVSRVDV